MKVDTFACDIPAVQIIPLTRAQWCVSCNCVSDAKGDICPACGDRLGLLSLARVMEPKVSQGSITHIRTQGFSADLARELAK